MTLGAARPGNQPSWTCKPLMAKGRGPAVKTGFVGEETLEGANKIKAVLYWPKKYPVDGSVGAGSSEAFARSPRAKGESAVKAELAMTPAFMRWDINHRGIDDLHQSNIARCLNLNKLIPTTVLLPTKRVPAKVRLGQSQYWRVVANITATTPKNQWGFPFGLSDAESSKTFAGMSIVSNTIAAISPYQLRAVQTVFALTVQLPKVTSQFNPERIGKAISVDELLRRWELATEVTRQKERQKIERRLELDARYEDDQIEEALAAAAAPAAAPAAEAISDEAHFPIEWESDDDSFTPAQEPGDSKEEKRRFVQLFLSVAPPEGAEDFGLTSRLLSSPTFGEHSKDAPQMTKEDVLTTLDGNYGPTLETAARRWRERSSQRLEQMVEPGKQTVCMVGSSFAATLEETGLNPISINGSDLLDPEFPADHRVNQLRVIEFLRKLKDEQAEASLPELQVMSGSQMRAQFREVTLVPAPRMQDQGIPV